MLKALGVSKYPINVDDASNKCPGHTHTGTHTSARKIAAQYLRKERKGDRWNLLRLSNHLKHGSIRYPDVYICVYMYKRCEHACMNMCVYMCVCTCTGACICTRIIRTHTLTRACARSHTHTHTLTYA